MQSLNEKRKKIGEKLFIKSGCISGQFLTGLAGVFEKKKFRLLSASNPAGNQAKTDCDVAVTVHFHFHFRSLLFVVVESIDCGVIIRTALAFVCAT